MANIRFAIERDGNIIANSNEQMTFRANAIVGSPDEPTAISFSGETTGIDIVGNYQEGKWYTVGGIQLSKKPTYPGVYIYNNRKVVIKK